MNISEGRELLAAALAAAEKYGHHPEAHDELVRWCDENLEALLDIAEAAQEVWMLFTPPPGTGAPPGSFAVAMGQMGAALGRSK